MSVQQVLVIGGRGRVGQGVVADLLAHTTARITITGRTPGSAVDLHPEEERINYRVLDLADEEKLKQTIATHNLVIHCAGPFRYRDVRVLKTCIEQGVNYLDVSDDRAFTQKALQYRQIAETAGVTAIINTGVFPGISTSMARQGVEHFDRPEEIHLRYGVAGSGGAAATVMQTTFLSLQTPFSIWLDGRWQEVKPYTGREIVELPAPFGKTGTYWFDLPESLTLVEAFAVKTVAVKFGSVPDFYNHMTWMVANWFPAPLLQSPTFVSGLSRISHTMTSVSDRFSGTGIAMRVEVRGQKANQPIRYIATFSHRDAATATGMGAGLIAQFILSEALRKPGVWSVEQFLPTHLFEQAMQERGIIIQQEWLLGH